MLYLRLLHLCLIPCGAFRLLSPPAHNGRQMLSPRARFWGGREEFLLNTSSFNAPFVDPGLSLSDCCEPFGVDDRSRIQGKVVAIGFGSFAEGCEIETSYLNLVDGGAFGIVLLPL